MHFLNSHDILFFSELKLDFTKIPLELHGRGLSNNLVEYLSNNSTDTSLIMRFIHYFISNIFNMKYDSGINFNYNILNSKTWQTMRFYVPEVAIPISTTTTTITNLCGFAISNSIPIENEFTILNINNNSYDIFYTPINLNFNYLYITIPDNKTLNLYNSLNINVSNTFMFIQNNIFYGKNNKLYRSNNIFYTGLIGIYYKIMM